MKTIYCLMASMAVTATGYCAATSGMSYFQDFSSLGGHGDPLPAGWVTYGNGEVPLPEWQSVFGDNGDGPYFRLMDIGGERGAFSNSSFREDLTADEWLVTPAIHVNSDNEMLLMTVGAYGANNMNNFRVFVSETGQEKEDFTQAPVIVSDIFGYTGSVSSKKVAARLEGYAGKDIYMAFVNRSKDAALLGVLDMMVAPYYAAVTDNTVRVLPAGENLRITLDAEVRTASNARGLKAVLSTSTGLESVLEFERVMLIGGTNVKLEFPETIVMPDEGVDYTVTLTPAMPGTEPTVITGRVDCPTTSYTPVAVIEELTGSWCSFCPRGAAFMEYFSDKYNDENGRVIGIAIHGQDLMTIDGGDYLRKVQDDAGVSGFPAAYFQRTVQNDPGSPDIIEILMNTPSYSAVKIDKVEVSAETPVKVNFSVEHAYDITKMNHKVAFVLLEDNIRGSDRNWNQQNNYAGKSQAEIEAAYGEELWPYFEFYVKRSGAVSYLDMVYNHVARGIYPDYYGLNLEGSCKAMEKVSFSYSFDRPDNVDNWNNTSVVAMLLDGATGRIITADKMEASDFNKDFSIVQTASEDTVSIVAEASAIRINGAGVMTAEVYGIDGVLVETAASDNGVILIPSGHMSGFMIVKVATAKGVVSQKVYIRH